MSSSCTTDLTASHVLEWKSVTWIVRWEGSEAWTRNKNGGSASESWAWAEAHSTLGSPNMGSKSSNPIPSSLYSLQCKCTDTELKLCLVAQKMKEDNRENHILRHFIYNNLSSKFWGKKKKKINVEFHVSKQNQLIQAMKWNRIFAYLGIHERKRKRCSVWLPRKLEISIALSLDNFFPY